MSFTPGQTKEYIPFVMAVGRAFQEVMNESGIPVERINFMDLGNWNLLTPKKPHFHLHLFGRARGSRYQIHAEFNKIPPKGSKHFEMLAPLNAEEKAKLIERIPRYFAENMRAMEKPKAGKTGAGAKKASFSSVEVAKAATDGAPSVDALEQELVGAERAAGVLPEQLVEDGFFVPGATPGVITAGSAARFLPH